MKWVAIGVGVLFVFGVISAAGLYFTARRYVTMAEDITGVKAGDVVTTLRDAASRSSQKGAEVKRDGCLLLTKEEASSILGVEVERVDGKPNEHESAEHCDFFIKPESAEVNAEKLKKSMEAARNAPPADSATPGHLPPAAADMLKTLNRAAVEVARNGEAPYFAFTVERENGRVAFTAFQIANQLSGVDAGQTPEKLDIGDKAAMGMADSRMCVVKNNSAVTLDLSQVTDGRNKGVELMKVVLARL